MHNSLNKYADPSETITNYKL